MGCVLVEALAVEAGQEADGTGVAAEAEGTLYRGGGAEGGYGEFAQRRWGAATAEVGALDEAGGGGGADGDVGRGDAVEACDGRWV